MADSAHKDQIQELLKKKAFAKQGVILPERPTHHEEKPQIQPSLPEPHVMKQVRMTFAEKSRFIALHSLGNFLLLFSIYGVFATFGPALHYEVAFRIGQARGVEYQVLEESEITEETVVNTEGGPTLGTVLAGSKVQVITPKDPTFSILIPKIGASAKVFPNVDAGNEAEFQPLLLQGIAHAKGTVFPGMNGNIYLFAHSTDNWWNVGRYNAVFYLLKDLQPGDEVIVYFEDIRHNYVVTGSAIADPTEVSYLRDSHGGEEQLVLQTCWPPGTTWKRIFVFAKPKASF